MPLFYLYIAGSSELSRLFLVRSQFRNLSYKLNSSCTVTSRALPALPAPWNSTCTAVLTPLHFVNVPSALIHASASNPSPELSASNSVSYDHKQYFSFLSLLTEHLKSLCKHWTVATNVEQLLFKIIILFPKTNKPSLRVCPTQQELECKFSLLCFVCRKSRFHYVWWHTNTH